MLLKEDGAMRFQRCRRSFHVWLVFLLLCTSTGFCAASSTVLDMSYKHYLDTIVLEEAIRSSLWDLPNDERAETFEVDISGSVLGNEKGMKEIILSLLPTSQPQGDDSNTAKSTTNISFLARHNRISPKSMDDLLQVLLSNKSANETEGDQKATTDQEKEAEDESSQKPFRLPWMVKKLDMGWNELQPDAPGWKNFLKSLQKLIQSRDSCPSIIRFDRCGLVPGACRAIGKVRDLSFKC